VKIASIRASEVVAGSSPLRRVGIGVEVEDFRKYAEGDDARHIDWRITTRKPSENGEHELFVREYRAERSLKPVLVVDMTASMGFWNKYLTSLYLSFLILHIMDNIRIYRSMDATILSSLLAREVCHNGPKGFLSLVDCLRYIHHKKAIVYDNRLCPFDRRDKGSSIICNGIRDTYIILIYYSTRGKDRLWTS